MVDTERLPIVGYGRHVRLDPKGEEVVELMQRMYSGAIEMHEWKWSELRRNNQYREYNGLASIGGEHYLVWVVNVEDWPEGGGE